MRFTSDAKVQKFSIAKLSNMSNISPCCHHSSSSPPMLTIFDPIHPCQTSINQLQFSVLVKTNFSIYNLKIVISLAEHLFLFSFDLSLYCDELYIRSGSISLRFTIQSPHNFSPFQSLVQALSIEISLSFHMYYSLFLLHDPLFTIHCFLLPLFFLQWL